MPLTPQSDPMNGRFTFTVPCMPIRTFGIWIIF
jgi:hypothetical protein